jgi:hypothetical protein
MMQITIERADGEDNLVFIPHLRLGRSLQTYRPYLSDVKAVRNS